MYENMPEKSVFDILKKIRAIAGSNPSSQILDLCDKAAELIDDYMIGGRVCRRDKINPLEAP